MKVFISHRTIDITEVDSLLSNLDDIEFISHRTLESTEEIWKEKVTTKMKKSDLVLFFLGSTSNQSKPINWEFDLAKKLDKKYYVIKLDKAQVPKYIKNSKFIENDFDKIQLKLKNFNLKSPDKLLLDQYKIMILSTEKVTDQRLKVNNLFFTVTTSLLSISALVGKLIGFDNDKNALLAVSVMFFFSIIAFIISIFWKKLINSYGELNTGKFNVIEEIENKLNTNLFQREWQILIDDIGYKSNTKTETSIINWFRFCIIIIGIIEFTYIINLQFNIF